MLKRHMAARYKPQAVLCDLIGRMSAARKTNFGPNMNDKSTSGKFLASSGVYLATERGGNSPLQLVDLSLALQIF